MDCISLKSLSFCSGMYTDIRVFWYITAVESSCEIFCAQSPSSSVLNRVQIARTLCDTAVFVSGILCEIDLMLNRG